MATKFQRHSHPSRIPNGPTDTTEVLTISELNGQVKSLLEGEFNNIWITGELSNFSTPSSGHWYFTLKDRQAQIRGAMFKGNNQRLRQRPKEGDQIIARGRLSLYAARGDYQIIVDHMEPAGRGTLQQAFEALKNRLANEGLFDDALKQTIPTFPNNIGIITSATGAALRDILNVLKRRFPATPVTLYPTAVQGQAATQDIINAINTANRLDLSDVIILARGGGSIEDLWCFNEERVARTIAASEIPIISGIGHQTDFTIADFVADVRAPTPSAAAELVSPNQQEILESLLGYEQWLFRSMLAQIEAHRRHLRHLEKRLKHPGRYLDELAQKADDLYGRLERAMIHRLNQAPPQLNTLLLRLQQQSPERMIAALQQRLSELQRRLHASMSQQLYNKERDWKDFAHRLHTISPLATLERGYSITRSEKGRIIKSTKGLKPGSHIRTHVNGGIIESKITSISEEATLEPATHPQTDLLGKPL